MKKNLYSRALFIVGGLAVLALIISLFAHYEPRFPRDLEVTRLFQSINTKALLAAMEGVSYATDGWRAAIIIVVGGVVAWWRLGRLEGGLVLMAGLLSFVNDALKIVIDRPRPTPDLIMIHIVETGPSFPSGRAVFAVVVIGILAYFIVTSINKPGLKYLTLLTSTTLILWMGASRIYLGAHWVSDVIGGYIVGGLFLVALIWVYRVLKSRLAAKTS